MFQNATKTKGKLDWIVFRGGRKASLRWKLSNMLRWLYFKGWVAKYLVGPFANWWGIATMLGELSAIKYHEDGTYIDYGTLGRRVVTTAFCADMVDELIAETSAWGDYKFHEMGTGTTAEAVGDVDIETVHGSAATGTQVEGTSVQYSSVATISAAGTAAITEHMISNVSSAATVMDRTVFSAINIVSGDSIQFTYTLTCTAGG
jgi:hypothetical protein